MLAFTPWLIKQELERRGYLCKTFEDKYLVLVNKQGLEFFYNSNLTSVQNLVAHSIAKDKYLAKEFFNHYNFPTAKAVRIERETIDKVSALKFPVVVKPLEEEGGKGVLVGVQNIKQIEKYFDQNPHYQKILVEETLNGEDARILIIRGKFFAAVKRESACVLGDGEHAVLELVQFENERREAVIKQQEASDIYLTNKRVIQYKDIEAEETLKEQGVNWDSIPSKGKKIKIRRNANLTTGGSSIDVTDMVCPQIRTMCEDIAKKLKTTTLGVDIMTKDLTQPLDTARGSGIIEINGNPGLSMHVFAQGKSRNPVSLMVDELEEHMQIHPELYETFKVEAATVLADMRM